MGLKPGESFQPCSDRVELWAERNEQDWFGECTEGCTGQHRGAREFTLTVDPLGPYRAHIVINQEQFSIDEP